MNLTIRKILPATLDHLHEAMEFVTAFAAGRGFSPGRIMEIELTLEEALVNIISYAYPGAAGEMEISCTVGGPDRFILEISDRGIPFDVLSIAEPDLMADVEERKVGGLGVYLIKKLMDDVVYRREEGRNILSMTVAKEKPAGGDGTHSLL